MKLSLTPRGVPVSKELLGTVEIESIKKELTVSPHGNLNVMQPPKYPIFLESKTKLYIPKSYALKRFGEPIHDIRYKGHDIDLEFTGELRPEQDSPVNAIMDACKDPLRMGGILNVFCGGGKTTMALYCIANLRKKALIVVHKEFLLTQWKERIEQFLPNATIGYIKGKILDVENKDIVIASLQSLSMKEYDSSIFNDFGTLIIDEVHHTSAEVFNRALFKTCMMYTIGLSATVKRKDGLSKVFMWHLGDIVYRSEVRDDTVNVDALLLSDTNDPDYSGEEFIGMSSKMNFSKMINKVCAYGPRTLKIVDVLTNIPPGRKVLVLSDRVAHLREMMYHVLQSKEKTCGLYVGGMKAKALKECEDKDIIFATFAIASEGYDQKNLDTLVLASPKTDIVQSVGRILRDKECDRKNIPRVIDIVDNFSVFEKMWFKRKTYFKKCKYTITSSHETII
jgi:superfamily II DNA or RNA helicase